MGDQQHIQGVGGQDGGAVRTSEDGSIQTDNYPRMGAFEHDGTAYPYSLDVANLPADVIQVLKFTDTGDIDMVVTNQAGDQSRIRVASTVGNWGEYEIESVTFEDPRGTAAPLYGAWAGE